MAIFVLDCDAVAASVGSLDSVYSQVIQIADSVRAYDTSCEDGFDFSSAKSSIVANIEACSVKIKNTIDLINYVVDSHTNLQNSIEFDSTYSNQIKSNETDLSVSENSSDKVSTTNVNNNFSNGNNSTNISVNTVTAPSVNSSTNNSTESSINIASSVVANEMISSSKVENDNEILNEKKDNGNSSLTSESNNQKQNNNNKDNNSIKSDSNETESNKKSNKVSKSIKKKIFSNKKFRYNSSGYGLLENRYVISCDESYGSVGDGLTIKCSDGTEVKCIIGSVNNSKNSINFYINGDIWKEGPQNEILTNTLDKVKNTGPIEFLSDSNTEII